MESNTASLQKIIDRFEYADRLAIAAFLDEMEPYVDSLRQIEDEILVKIASRAKYLASIPPYESTTLEALGRPQRFDPMHARMNLMAFTIFNELNRRVSKTTAS